MGRNQMGFGGRLVVVLALACIFLFSALSYLYITGRGVVDNHLVGVIHIEETITSTEAAGLITAAINQAFFNSNVKAIVLRIDSPGGSAHLVEQIYLDVLELKQRKPVVASVVTALSGGYYIAVAANHIYTHPSSMVGNLGVMGVAPENVYPSESNLESGPYKMTGFSKLLFPFNLSHALESFVAAVTESREARLKLSLAELRKGMIYIGSEAVSAGLVDEIGSLQKAAEYAAREAGLETYRVVDIPYRTEVFGLSTAYQNRTSIPWCETTLATLNSLNPPPAIYYLYLPQKAYQNGNGALVSNAGEGNATAPKTSSVGQVVVDLSHGNMVSPWVLHLLSSELAPRGVVVGYDDNWTKVESTLESVSCLIVAAPTETYLYEEFKAIDEFVSSGRILLMFFDPATEYVEETSPLGSINSLANRFGLTFGKGYLYNMEDHYGIYRNIYVRDFENTSMTRNLESVVLFTATYLHQTDGDAAYTSRDTYASVAERRGIYSPISVVDKGNGTVVALGDLTFFMEPYVYVEDNYQLLMNIVHAIAEVEVPVVEKEEERDYNITEPDLPVGTVKLYTQSVDEDEEEVQWMRTAENETQVERAERVTVYHYDGEGRLMSWESDGWVQVNDSPLPGLPYPLFKGKAWAYRSNYTLTHEEDVFKGWIEGRGFVAGFEEVEDGSGERYVCAKVSVEERDELARLGHNMTTVSSKYQWVSQEVGLVKAESDVRFYVDSQLRVDETRILLLVSVEKGAG